MSVLFPHCFNYGGENLLVNSLLDLVTIHGFEKACLRNGFMLRDYVGADHQYELFSSVHLAGCVKYVFAAKTISLQLVIMEYSK